MQLERLRAVGARRPGREIISFSPCTPLKPILKKEVSSSSGSTQAPTREVIDVSHISATSPYIVTTRRWGNQTLPRGQAFQVDRSTGRTRVILTGEFIPEAEEDTPSAEPEDDQRVSAVSVGAVRATGSEDHYCMLDSGANVMVIPWKRRHGR